MKVFIVYWRKFIGAADWCKKSGLEDAIQNHHNGKLLNPRFIRSDEGVKKYFCSCDKYFHDQTP